MGFQENEAASAASRSLLSFHPSVYEKYPEPRSQGPQFDAEWPSFEPLEPAPLDRKGC